MKSCRWARKAVAAREKLSLGEKSCRWARKAVAGREKLSLGEKSCRCARKAVAAREKLSLREKSCRCARKAVLGKRARDTDRSFAPAQWIVALKRLCLERGGSNRAITF